MSLSSWLTQTAYRAAVTGTDSYGRPSYGTPASFRVRVELEVRMVRNAQGEEVQSTHKLWSLTPVSVTDRLWLPGTDSTNADVSKLPLAVNAVGDKSASRTLYEVRL